MNNNFGAELMDACFDAFESRNETGRKRMLDDLHQWGYESEEDFITRGLGVDLDDDSYGW